MDVDSFIKVMIFLLSLSLTALLSSAEVVLSSLSRSSLERLKDNGIKHIGKILKIYQPRRKLHLSVAIAKFLAIIVATAALIILAQDLSPRLGVPRGVGLLGALLIVFFAFFFFENVVSRTILGQGEASLPKIAFPVYLLYMVLLPLTNLVYRFFPKEADLKEMKEEELRSIVESETEEGIIEEEEKEMINSIFEFADTSVKEVMVPRIDMVCAEDSVSLQELVSLIREAGHSRIPIFEETVDNIKGIVYAKDLLQMLRRPDQPDDSCRWDLNDVMREAYFVPENKKIDEMLGEFKAKKIHMAIVVDEYGGTAGLVTLEDLLEEIVGEIQDEYDTEEQLYSWVDEGVLVADARIDIHDLNEMLETDLPRERFETLGGFIYNLLGSIPNEGQVFEFKNLEMRIERVKGQRISKVRIVKKSPGDEEDQEKSQG